MNHATKDSENILVRFDALFILDILIPKRMRKEIQPNTFGSSFKKPVQIRLVSY